MRDILHKIKLSVAKVYGDYNAATVDPVAVDLQGYNGAMFFINVGTMTGTGTFTPVLQESDNGTDFTDVAAAEIVGTAPVALTSNSTQSFGYAGVKQYVGVKVVKAGTVSAANFGITAVRGRASLEPLN